MPWFMVDDKLHSHRKRHRAGVEAMGLWVVAGSWAADQLTDGFVPDYIAADIDPRWRKHVASLVDAGLWYPDKSNGDTGWRFHEWDDRNPTHQDVERKRQEARERMARVRSRSAEVRANESRTNGEVQANDARSSREVRSTPTLPSPTPPSVGSSNGGGSPPVTPETPPPRSCTKHPNGTDEPCGRCADARKAADAWRPPTLSAKTTMCGEHPAHPALNCPECAAQAADPPADWRPKRSAS